MKEEKISINNIDYNDFSEENARKIVNNFKVKDASSLKLFLDYIENYYRANKNVNVFKYSDIYINIVEYIGIQYEAVKLYGSNSNYENLIEILKKFTSKNYFTELFNPLNSKTIDICRFQENIDKIYQCTGIYLQDKYSKLYKQICSTIKENIRKLCLRNKSLIESIPKENRKKFLSNNAMFYLGLSCTRYDDDPCKEIMENSKYIKIYVDLVISELFKTSPNVVYFDIISMFKVNKELHFLSDEDVKLYNDIDKLQEIVDKLKSINIVDKFYDDMLKARRISAQRTIRDLYKPNDDDLCHDEKYPDAVIYDLRDENKKFNIIIRGLTGPFMEKATDHMRFLCCSLRNDSMTKPHWGTFIYGYEIGEDDIVWQSESDHFTRKNNDELISEQRSILIPGGGFLLDEINIVNDVVVENGKTKYVQRKPSYIVAYDEITDDVYNESKRLNIPIYLARTIDNVKESDYYMRHEADNHHYFKSNNILSSEEISTIRH